MRNIICVGASAGGVEALRSLVQGLAPELAASVFVVLHVPPGQPSRLSDILDRSGPIRASMACDGERFARSRIYVAPPDHHLILDGTVLRVIKGPMENRFRPAIDPLFRSAAEQFPERTIGVILSGMLDDGIAGLWALKRSGGLTVIQDVDDALFPEMPTHAARQVEIDQTATAAAMGPLLSELVAATGRTMKAPLAVARLTRIENQYARLNDVPLAALEKVGAPSSLKCPMCHATHWRIKSGPMRFRCHKGHAFTPSTLNHEQRERAEQTLAVLTILFYDEVTLSRIAVETCNDSSVAQRLKRELSRATKRATAIRKLLPGAKPRAARPNG